MNPITHEEVLTLLNSRSNGLTRARMAELGLGTSGTCFGRCHIAIEHQEDRFCVHWNMHTYEQLGRIVDTQTGGLLEELKAALARRALERL